MSSGLDQSPPPSGADSGSRTSVETRSDAAHAFWRILTHFDSTKLSVHRAARNAIGVVLPLIVGYALQMPRGGLVVASGALNVSYSDGSDPYADRARRMLASTFICAVAVFAGALSGKHQVFAIMLATGWAFIVGMSNALGGAAPDLGVISLVILLIYAAQPLTAHQALQSGVLALAGGLLQTALSVALWPVRRYDPERRALAKFYLELADRAAAPLNPTAAPLASIHSEQAQETLLGLGRDAGPESMRYRALLSQGERMRLSLLVLQRLRLRMERENHNYPAIPLISRYLELGSQILREISSLLYPTLHSSQEQSNVEGILEALQQQAAQLREQVSATSAPFLGAVAKDALFQMEALGGQLRASLDLARNTVPLGEANSPELSVRSTWRENLSTWMEAIRGNLNLRSAIYRHALRLAVLVALGDIVGRSVSWRRSYWLPMTIVLVLKPEFSATFSRGLLRIVGTIVGLLLATGLFHVLPSGVAPELILIFTFVFLLRWLGPANYGIFGVVVSALIVLLLAVTGVSPKDVIWARGINTVIGGAMALLAYRLWPTWERTRVSERIAQMLDAYREYVHVLSQLDPNEDSYVRELERTRRSSRAARANLQASVDRLSSEPGTTRDQMSRLNAALASSHRFVHAAMALDAIFSQDPTLANSPPFKNFAANVEQTLTLLASILRGIRVMSKDLPNLREEHRLMVQARNPGAESGVARYDSIDVEADRMTNSLNTLAEQIMQWTRSAEFAELHKLTLNPQTREA
jgi:uncharacterized membrane protein YccC